MAEFRKREDITQEIGLLQQWSELGAPRMQELQPNLRSLVKSFEPRPGAQIEIRTTMADMPPDVRNDAPSAPPPDVRQEHVLAPVTKVKKPERPPVAPPSQGADDDGARSWVLPALAGAMLVASGAVYLWSKDLLHVPNTPWAKHPDAGKHPTGKANPGAQNKAKTGPETKEAALPEGPDVDTRSRPAQQAGTKPVPAGTEWSAVQTKPGDRKPRQGAQAPAQSAVAHLPARSLAKNHVLPDLKPVRPVVRQVRVTEYVVQRGDSLSAIAAKNLGVMGRWTELHQLNRSQIANPDLIFPGQRLKMPTVAQKDQQATRLYTAKPGDSLRRIARTQLGDAGREGELYALNAARLPGRTLITPGTRIILPARPTGPADGPHARGLGEKPGFAGVSSQAATSKSRQHVVQHGESLSLLARRYLGSAQRWPEIYYMNRGRIAHSQWIYPGQVLTIPTARTAHPLRYVVQTGDSLWLVANRQMGSPSYWPRIWRANRNQIANPHWIFPGQTFRLPR